MHTSTRVTAGFALAAALAFTPSAVPCTQPCVPGAAKSVAVVWTEAVPVGPALWKVPLRVTGYKIAGGGAGEYCTCAFGAGVFDKIQSIDEFAIYYAGTDTKIPGFDAFAQDATATGEWAALAGGGGDWTGFLAPVLSDLPANSLVDLEFRVVVEAPVPAAPAGPSTPVGVPELGNSGAANPNTQTGCLGDACPDRVPREAITAVLVEELASATVGTDAATVNGVLLNHHQSLESLGELISQDALAFDYVPGAIAGTAGTPSLTGSGSLGVGDDGALHLSAAKPNVPAFLVLGLSTVRAPLKGGVLVPSLDVVIDVFTDGDGMLTLPWSDLPDLGASFDLAAQVWIPDRAAVKGFAASNGLVLHL